MNITERTQKVLAEIDAALALAEKANTGYVYRKEEPNTIYIGNDLQQQSILLDSRKAVADGTFIAASRTGWPTSLHCLKTATEGLLRRLTMTDYNPEKADCIEILATLCDQWHSSQ